MTKDKIFTIQYSGFTVEFSSLEEVKAHLRTNHLVTEESYHPSSIILPDNHLIPEHQVNQFARDDGDDGDEDDYLRVLEEIAPPRFSLEADEEEKEVEVLEEIPPVSFRKKRAVSENWRVALLKKMREMKFLPPDQLAVQLRKAKQEKKKKKKEEKFLEILKNAVENKKERSGGGMS